MTSGQSDCSTMAADNDHDDVSRLQQEIATLQAELKQAHGELQTALKKLEKAERLHEKANRYNEDLCKQVDLLSKELHEYKSVARSRVEVGVQVDQAQLFSGE